MSDHPFTYDRWATPDDPEFGIVRVDDLRKIERACGGIWAIARIVGSGVGELEATGTIPLNAWVVSNLMGGVESICDQIADLVGRTINDPTLDSVLAKAVNVAQ
ncbi:hypothetical protein RAS12_04075 [Achromobacter seleniivolatilans]|uniref:Uncharacterized protein n=1 Tax=Achromobacter seleniivolatilans TaxID=3047478 RepID=A0ABY9M3N2_9BURK|nr:hypothetical protein [Achromobacter sp. R39]WMD21560.1 hypothetical protein RAS12_04075 [Achromobacter sp. R39]